MESHPVLDYYDFKEAVLAVIHFGPKHLNLILFDRVCRDSYKIDYDLTNGLLTMGLSKLNKD